MNIFKSLTFGLVLFFFLSSCKKDITRQTVYDNVIYEVNPVSVYASNAEKTKQKSPAQFIAILYSNLTNKTIPGDDLNNLSELALSFGDKELMNNVLLENFLADPEIKIPTNEEMRSNMDEFVNQTYLKFFLRYPTAYEKYFLKDLISKDAAITSEMVYAAFAQSNEYLFY
ncbi:MAG: hypothetical protein ABIO46_00955 [Chitinophagales bacterium]